MAKRIVAYLLKQDVIEKQQEEIYTYGFQQLFAEAVSIVSIFLIGFLFNELLGVLGFFVTFRLLRSYAGGYHAETRVGCYFLTMIVITISLSTIKYITINSVAAFILWMLFGMAICFWAPVEAENKPLDQIEIEIYGKKAKQIWCMETIVFLICLAVHWETLYESILMANMCTCLSLMIVKVEK